VTDRVDRLIAWLEAHRAELEAAPTGGVRFDWTDEVIKAAVHRYARLPGSATLHADGPPARTAVAR
jgi:hypothetical protein